ncbi:hypothetical protein BV22DRAFT_1128632 [Leucogyrophana mollusca]|uniref:Uncharacterized protein n=1 Tax=Leucogyrophana mollusca TaxID=85980 RepID=A0ACB8BJ29_9AGAM|nr:hypothetical protein BV22DRAFT_1128632 [Leucogyrophana mollusca]
MASTYASSYPQRRSVNGYYIGSLATPGRTLIHTHIPTPGAAENILYLQSFFPNILRVKRHYFRFYDNGCLILCLIAFYDIDMQRSDAVDAPYLLLKIFSTLLTLLTMTTTEFKTNVTEFNDDC